jgi:hypothetical protein
MALRLRYRIDSPRRLREHVHLVDGAGYFFFPGAVAPKGTLASLEIDFSATAQGAVLRGWVWARSSSRGLWLELAGAQRCLEKLDQAPTGRSEIRLASDQLILAEPQGLPALLCRLRDVSHGGARLSTMPSDAGALGQGMRVALPEAAPEGGQLEAYGRVVWAGEGDAGVQWNGDSATRAAVRRLVHNAQEEWNGAKTAVHPATCRCLTVRPTEWCFSDD